MGRVRVRQHVNPLSQAYQTPVNPPQWDKIYADMRKPLHMDIGCGWGRFLLSLAQWEPDWNFLGLEIRESLVETAIAQRDEKQIPNLHFLFCNANPSLQPLLDSLPPGILQRVSIQFPDPWFKKRHQKRRVVQPELVADIAHYLSAGGVVFLQSDVEEVAIEMRDRFQEHPAFVLENPQWLPENPLAVATERERLTLDKGEPVYRAVFRKGD
ncbi:tRNA (guanosine(46)-N7)-methyltransferase TrmB [Phormidium sp. CCY1219]|uniref:tRNA (guanosine(46)-N7)-methyltransferase TrmB n=1 Tax=Phormidium sp. CCY1219 TaxID=2886104 RepID=UPI002D1EDA48|nr:tRNA (guanosine(46)-N7)-methyltransferase TrmB [Phormidium sp. CCY1219]MEB3831631.1 tRNA (guanosine(46)-N7)-methyltransferase TrmB [Phormidium sp. CCY1219]